MKYNDKILLCGNGAGFMAVECLAGVYRAFEEAGEIPGRVMSSSGSTLFTSIYYSKESIDWVDELIENNPASNFVQFSTVATARTLMNKSHHMLENEPVYDLLKEHMNGNASKRILTSVTRNADWTTHMKRVTPGWSLAATSIPFVFKPVKIAGELWCDGGVLNNLPIPTIEETKNWDRIFVFVAPPTTYLKKDSLISNLVDLLQAIMDREIQQLQEIGFFDLPNVTVIRPSSDFGGNLLDWSPNFILRKKTYELTKGLL